MQASARKLIIARHSGAEFEIGGNRVYKISPGHIGRPTIGTRRVNTEVNEKKSGQKKYILKKNRNESTLNLHGNSKQSSYSKQKSNAWDKTYFHENQWMLPNKEQQTIKKSTQKPGLQLSKAKQLQKIIRSKKQNHQQQQHHHQNIGEECSNSIKHRSKARVIMDCDSILFSKKSTQINLQNSCQKTWFDQGRPKYEIIHDKLLGSGTFGKVYAGKCNRTGQTVAIKTFQIDKSHKCRQVQLMQLTKSKFVIRILDKYNTIQKIKETQKQYINIIMPKYQSSFFQYLKSRNYTIDPSMLKIYLYQIFKGVHHLHSRGICHRDLKPQNVLISRNRLVICDLGSAKILKKSQPNISYICSRCYRAPELIFGSTFYGFYIDIWSVGCIILEILNKAPFFIAKDSLHHLIQIMKVMGTPTKKQVLAMNPNYDITCFEDIPIIAKKSWKEQFPDCDIKLLDLIQKIMVYNPSKRITAQQALQHPYFSELRNTHFIMSVANEIDCFQLISST